MVPVFINSFNQLTYLKNMVSQLSCRNVDSICIIDQCSTDEELLDYLNDIRRSVTVINLRQNLGPHWFFMEGLSLSLPEWYAYTDPDLHFKKEMPYGFLSDLRDISKDLQATKVGLALDVSNTNEMHLFNINIGGKDYTNIEWEQQFWQHPVDCGAYSVYRSPVDTTFALYNRGRFDTELRKYIEVQVYDAMDTPGSFRVAGPYSVYHLPWMKFNPIPEREAGLYVRDRIKIHNY